MCIHGAMRVKRKRRSRPILSMEFGNVEIFVRIA